MCLLSLTAFKDGGDPCYFHLWLLVVYTENKNQHLYFTDTGYYVHSISSLVSMVSTPYIQAVPKEDGKYFSGYNVWVLKQFKDNTCI